MQYFLKEKFNYYYGFKNICKSDVNYFDPADEDIIKRNCFLKLIRSYGSNFIGIRINYRSYLIYNNKIIFSSLKDLKNENT